MTRARLLEIASLARRRGREAHGQFLVEGVRAVESAVAAGAPIVEVLATPEAMADPRVSKLLQGSPAPVVVVPLRDLARVSDVLTTQGVAAVVRCVVRPLPVGDAAPVDAGTAVVLDGVQDPGNVGTIVRTASWFGIDLVIAGPGTADLESPKVVRATMGGMWDLTLMRATDLPAALNALSSAGFTLHGADAAGEPLDAWRPAGRVGLVLGSEAHGLSHPLPAGMVGTVAIPRGGRGTGVESLNVAVAAGILLQRWRGRPASD